MKKLIASLLAVSLVFAITACNGNDSDSAQNQDNDVKNSEDAGDSASGDKKKIRIAWNGLNPDDRVDPISGITYKGSYEFKELLEKKIPEVEIEFIQIPSDGWIQKMETTITAGEADIGWYTNQVMAAEWFVDHRDFMKNDPEFSEETFDKLFTEGAKKYTRYHSFDYPDQTGEIHGLPYDVGAYYIMYDKQILEEWGVAEPSQNPTFDELMEIIQATTGTNPVSGKENYGTYIRPFWCEWVGVGADLYHPIDIPDMDIDKLDIAKDVDYMKTSPEILDYFQMLLDMIECAPEGVTADTGHENWLTPDNNIAVMFDTSKTSPYYHHLLADNKEVTDRFIPIFLPKGEQGVSGFPEVHHVAVTKLANNKELCWEVVKAITTDTDVLNLIYKNHAVGVVPALIDTTGIDIMKDEFVQLRYNDRLNGTIITDDYWYWREPIQGVFGQLFVKELTAEQAREALHASVMEWINNKKSQLGK